MKKALFYLFLFVFGATALVTLLGLTQIIQIEQEYLSKLFYMLIAESIVSVIALFKKTNFFGDDSYSVLILPKDSFPRKGEPYQCIVCVYNQKTDVEKIIDVTPKRRNGYLSAYLETISENELIKVSVKNTQNDLWESEYFKPSVAKAEMVQL